MLSSRDPLFSQEANVIRSRGAARQLSFSGGGSNLCRRTFQRGVTGGIGITVGDIGNDNWLGGVDLDSSAINGVLSLRAADILAVLPTCSEISPSNSGFKEFFQPRRNHARRFLDLIGVGPNNWECKRSIFELSGTDHGPGIEVYAGAWFFTVTGQRWSSRASVDRSSTGRSSNSWRRSRIRSPSGRGQGTDATPAGQGTRWGRWQAEARRSRL